jgi:hypothetical protein
LKAAAKNSQDEAAKAVETAAAEQKQATERERERAEALSRQFATARQEIETLKAAAKNSQDEAAKAAQAAIAEGKRAVDREREAVEGLKRDLAGAREELEFMQARAAGATALQNDAAEAARAAAAEHKQAADREHDRAEKLTRELSAAREEFAALEARTSIANAAQMEATQALRTTAAEQRLALDRERARADATARELASARREFETKIRNAINTPPKAPPPAKPAAPQKDANGARVVATLARVSPVGDRSEAVEGEPERSELEQGTSLPAPDAEQAPQTTSSAGPAEEARLLARAQEFIRRGDISGARLMLQRALDAGSMRAALVLGETFDPRLLTQWKAYGTTADPGRARELYMRAYAGGLRQAKERLDTLR